MKKITKKQRLRDVRAGIVYRQGREIKTKRLRPQSISRLGWQAKNKWIDKWKDIQLNIESPKKRHLTLVLPEKMNFFEDYDSTVLHISAIRELAGSKKSSSNAYKLGSVNFDSLRKISTSAALVLTAELSKWDDVIRQKLRPKVDNWDSDILKQFTDLGFFDLFQYPPSKMVQNTSTKPTSINLVKYIKGKCRDSEKARLLKQQIMDVIGSDEQISKWTFLHSGLTEAITNVSHHAYPMGNGFSEEEKNWYLTGSYDEDSRELKIVFYDQGIGIPKSLPLSKTIWEKILQYLSKSNIGLAERKRDEVLLGAAMQLNRTSTDQPDRGKGLQDLLEFIRQRKDGDLSILSLKGLYKFSIMNGEETVKTERFQHPINGTLIIWNAILSD